MIRKKVKLTINIIDPAPGAWGMHDGWGNWDNTLYYRIFGILICKKHLRIPKREYSDFGGAYYFTCRKCEIKSDYEYRKRSILAERKKGRLGRLKEIEESKKAIAYLKSLYDSYFSD